MTKDYQTMTRVYTVTDDGVQSGHVLVIGKRKDDGKVVDAAVVETIDFPAHINQQASVIQLEEVSHYSMSED